MKHALCEMLLQVRSTTLSQLENTPHSWTLWSPPGTSNHILWHAGHVLWVQDLLCVQKLTGKSDLEQDWADAFGMDCTSVSERTDWPKVSIVETRLTEQRDRIVDLLMNADAAKLRIDRDNPKDLVGGIIHGFHDEAKHQGEIHLLQKMLRAEEQSLA